MRIVFRILALAFLIHLVRGDAHFEGDEEDEDPARQGRIGLCTNMPSCSCNGRTDEAECLCTKVANNKPLSFLGVQIPDKLKTLTIRNCSSVDLHNPQLAKAALTKLSIHFIGELSIAKGTLRRIDQVEMQHIDHLNLDGEAFNEVEANDIQFTAISFSPDTKIAPRLVRRLLDFEFCELSDGMVIQAKQSGEELQVLFDGCRISRLQMELNVADFEMKGNQFIEISDPDAFLIRFSRSLTLEHNNYLNLLLPDVRCDISAPRNKPTSSIDLAVSVQEGKNWWRSFRFTQTDIRATTTTRGRVPSNPNTDAGGCQDLKALEAFFKTQSTTSGPLQNQTVTPTRLPSKGNSHFLNNFNIAMLVIIAGMFDVLV